MKRKIITIIGGVLVAVALDAAPVLAAPGDHGQGVGGCIDDVYGNATNERPGGHGVLPSQSPGPFVNTGVNVAPRNDRVRGASIGDVQKGLRELGLDGSDGVAICRAS